MTRTDPFHPSPSGLLPKLAVRLCELAGLLVLAWIAAQAFWFVIYGPALQKLDINPGAVQGAAATASTPFAVQGLARGLFSTPNGQGAVQVQAAPETRLNLNLRGVRRGARSDQGSAVIESPDAGQRSIAVGGEIAPGVTLDSVFADRVIINRNGARESLFLTEAAAQRAQERQSQPSQVETPTQAARSGTYSETASALSGEPDLDIAADLDREDWIDGLRLEPALENGQVIGLRVRDNTRLEILRASGLLPGDIVTALNGESLRDAQAAARAAEGLEERAQADFTVRRDGQTLTLSVPLN